MTARVVVLTSTFLRHQFVVNRLAERLDVVGVWQEEKSFEPLRYADGDDDERVIAAHFAARDTSESAWFDADRSLRLQPSAEIHRVGPGGCNSRAAIDAMKRLAPDVLLVFGTGILKRELISAVPRLINLHLGLSPYYRGAGTNFWPLVNREPEYVGATIHYLDEGVDTGPIIMHVRPDMRVEDGPHDVGNRTIVAAVDALAAAALAHLAGRAHAVPQRPGGRVYRRKDFSATAVRALQRNFADGMLGEYLGDKQARDAALELISLS